MKTTALTGGVLGAILLAMMAAHAGAAGAPTTPTVAQLETVGTTATTTEGLDCYGSVDALEGAIAARGRLDDSAANAVRIEALQQSQGYTIDADQQFTVTAVNGSHVRVELRGGLFDRFRCWANADDAQAVL